jgi:gamma-glutamyltranspeptidase/glutathione hydrolase
MNLSVTLRLFAVVCGVLSLIGCAADLGLRRSAPPQSAIVVGDEPLAVQAGASILSQGGNAVDAATATYFGLSVTYPVAAGLGGGGICIVHDPASGRNVELDFLARDSAGGGAYAVPGNVRGFAAMQSAFGRLPWQRLIAIAEGYAATGFAVSQSLATRLLATENVIRLDASLAAEFMDESGHVITAGTRVANRELADTLAAIRTKGPNAFYAGSVGAKLAAYSEAQGGTITLSALAAFQPMRTDPNAIQFGNRIVVLPGKATGAGTFAGALFDRLSAAKFLASETGSAEAPVVAAVKQTLTDFGVTNLPSDLGATGFVTIDKDGQAVACAVTMNGPFGSGHTVEGTGVTLSPSPGKSQAGLSAAFLTPVIVETGDGSINLVAVGAGGPIGTASIADALVRLAKGQAVTRRRSNGEITNYDTMNAILCDSDTVCVALPDAGASGVTNPSAF